MNIDTLGWFYFFVICAASEVIKSVSKATKDTALNIIGLGLQAIGNQTVEAAAFMRAE